MKDMRHKFREDTGMAPTYDQMPGSAAHDGSARIRDNRVAQLLLVLSEIDESVASLGGLPESQISSLVAGAIQSCGFTNPTEVRSVVACVLEAIGVRPLPRRYEL